MSTLLRSARSFALALAVAAGGVATVHQTAEACGGYNRFPLSESDQAALALQAFLGELSQRVSFGAAKLTDRTHAEIVIEMDTRVAGGRAKARQTFLLEKRADGWKVVDWTLPVRAPKVAARR